MDSTGVDPSMRKQAQEGATLLVGMDPTGGEPWMRKQAEEESEEAALMGKKWRAVSMRKNCRMATPETAEALFFTTNPKARPRREKKTAGKKSMEGGSRSLVVMVQQTRVPTCCSDRKNPSDTPNRFAMLDLDSEDEKDEMIDRGKSAIKELGDSKNPSDRGEESAMKVGRGKSDRDQEVICPETEESVSQEAATQRANNGKLAKKWKKKQKKAKAKAKAEVEAKARDEEAGKTELSATEPGRPEESLTEAEKAVMKEAEEGALLAGGLNSTGAGSSMLRDSEEEEESRRISEEQLYAKIQRSLLDIQEKLTKGKNKKKTLQLLKDVSDKLETFDEAMFEEQDDDETDEIPDELLLDPLAKEMADEAERFASYSRLWEYKRSKTCGSFADITVMNSMQFTHYTPGRMPCSNDCSALETLQIISIKLTGLAGGLALPLSVYGVVAVRDMVDRNRNILFFRRMSEAQELKQNDPFLHLIGPSRAIVFMDKVSIEIQLRVKGGAYSSDKALISCARCYTGGNGPGVSTICFENSQCTLELCLEPVKQSVQATILGVQVASDDDGSWPLKYGGLVACSPLSGRHVFSDSGYSRSIDPSSSQIVLIESQAEAMPKGRSGHVLLPRQVVSVQLEGRLDVVIKAYSKSGAVTAETRVPFYPRECNISQMKCSLGDAAVTVTVAWSLVVGSKDGLQFALSCKASSF